MTTILMRREHTLIMALILSAWAWSLSACSGSTQARCQDCLTKASTQDPSSAQALSSKAQALLSEGRAAQRRQEYTQAYDLHRQALWTLQAKQRLFAPDTTDPQEVTLRVQTLPRLQTQALISSSVLGWASVLVEQTESPYMLTTLRLDLLEAYALLDEHLKVSQLKALLDQSDASHSFTEARVKKVQRLAKARRTSSRELLFALDLASAGAQLAGPWQLRAQARLAISTLWPPQHLQHDALEVWAETQQLHDLSEHGHLNDLAISAALYCHYGKSSCVNILKNQAAASKDAQLLAMTALLNFVFFYAEPNPQARVSLMWTYYWLMREQVSMERAQHWLVTVGVPLLTSDKLRHAQKQRIDAAERLFEHHLDSQALKLLKQLQGEPRGPAITALMIQVYTKNKDVTTALRLFDALEPTAQSAALLTMLLEALATKGDTTELQRLEQLQAPTARYQATTKVALAFAQRGDQATATALLKRAAELDRATPPALDYEQLDGRLYHLRALSELNEHAAALKLIQAHLQDLVHYPSSAQLQSVAMVAITAGELKQDAPFELALKTYLKLLNEHSSGPRQDQRLIKHLTLTKRYKRLADLITSHATPLAQTRALASMQLALTELHNAQQISVEPALLHQLNALILAQAKELSVYSVLEGFAALCIKAGQRELAIDLARTLYQSAHTSSHSYSMQLVANALIKHGEPERGIQLYDELHTDAERLELLGTLSDHIDTGDEARTQRLLHELITRVRSLPVTHQDSARALVPAALAKLSQCELAVQALDPPIKHITGASDPRIATAAKRCLYAHKPAQALQLIEHIHMETNKARALIQVGYFLDWSGQHRQPEIQAILKRAAKALEAP